MSRRVNGGSEKLQTAQMFHSMRESSKPEGKGGDGGVKISEDMLKRDDAFQRLKPTLPSAEVGGTANGGLPTSKTNQDAASELASRMSNGLHKPLQNEIYPKGEGGDKVCAPDDGAVINTNDFDPTAMMQRLENVDLDALMSPEFDEEEDHEEETVSARRRATRGRPIDAEPSGQVSSQPPTEARKPKYPEAESGEESTGPSELTKFLFPSNATLKKGARKKKLSEELVKEEHSEDLAMAALQAQFQGLAKQAEDVLRLNKKLRAREYLQRRQYSKELEKLKHQCLGMETKVRLLKRQLKDREPRRLVPRAPKLTLHERMNRRFAKEAIPGRPAWSSRVNPNSFRYQFNGHVSLLESEGQSGSSRPGSSRKKGGSVESPAGGFSPRSASSGHKERDRGQTQKASWVASTPIGSRKKLHSMYTVTADAANGRHERRSHPLDISTRPAFTSTVGSSSFRLRENKRNQVRVSYPLPVPQKKKSASNRGATSSPSARGAAPTDSINLPPGAKTVKIALAEGPCGGGR